MFSRSQHFDSVDDLITQQCLLHRLCAEDEMKHVELVSGHHRNTP